MQEVNLIGVLSTGGRLPVIESKTITANGTYNVPSGVDGFNPVVVDVPSKKEITLYANQNGTYTPDEGKVYNNVVVNVPLPQNAYLLKSVANLPQAIASFNDGQEMVMSSLKVAIEPQQDLHGYDSPWVGGSGKNLFNMGSKWSGSASELSFTTDDDYVTINGTKNGGTYITPNQLIFDLTAGTYYVKTIVIGGTTSIQPQLTLIGNDISIGDTIGNERSFTLSNTTTISVRFAFWNDGATFNNYKLGIVVSKTPNIDKFYPYSNICPISGWNAVDVTVADDVENPTVSNVYTIDLDGTRYGGTLDVVNGIVTPAPYYASYNGETLTGEWISDRDKYEVGATPTIGAQVVNIGASGTPVSILPTAVKSLRGVNNVWADTGDITDAEYFSK